LEREWKDESPGISSSSSFCKSLVQYRYDGLYVYNVMYCTVLYCNIM
jgi:hypothetical protein